MKGLIVGGVLLGLGGIAFYLWQRGRGAAPQMATGSPVPAITEPATTTSGFFDNMISSVTSVLEPRGIRNHNPGNLVLTTIAWKGKVPNAQNTDKKFEQFTQPLWGIRAMFIDVRGDIEKDGLNTIRKLITEYAPKIENNTAAYIQSVVNQVGIGPDARILPAHYLNLLKAIIRHENGKQPYSDVLIIEAMNTK